MRRPVGWITNVGAAVTAACLCWSAPALAAQQTTLTAFSGTVTAPPEGMNATGKWTRTITDLGEPNGPGGEAIQGTYPVEVNWATGMTASQVADAYRAACIAALPGPETGPNGYGTARENRVVPIIRLSKQSGTYDLMDDAYPPGITVTTFVPATAEDAPAASPAALASLAASLSALAYWARRRRKSA